MKVLHVLARLTHSGAERQFECSFEQWRAAGIEPVIAGMAGGEHPYAAALEAAGYEVVIHPSVRSIRGLVALRKTMARVKPEIVHIGNERAADAVSLLAVSCPSVRGVVRTVHGVFQYTGGLRLRRSLRNALTRRLGTVWVSVASEVAETELRYFKNPTRVIEGFVDVDSIVGEATTEAGRRVRDELGIDADSFVLGMIGNCAPVKNHELVAQALTALTAPVHLLHVGHRTDATATETAAWRRVPEIHTVHHLGARDDVPALLAACDLALLPSRHESLSNVAIESLCAGIPLIGADVVGLQWLASVAHARRVRLDPIQWASAIGDAVRNPIEVSIDAIDAVRNRFRPERAVAEYLTAYEDSIDGRLFLRRRRPSAQDGRRKSSAAT
jgi:glycosyltransferase involved in cell wall biosynthesis